MISKVLPSLIIALLLALTAPAHALPRDLLAAASDQALVLAHVEPPDKNDPDATTVQSMIISRRLGKDTRWTRLATLKGRVVSIAACDEDAKVLLDSGDWMTIWADGAAFGPPAPNVTLLALAADQQGELWAIGRPTDPSTQPAAAIEQSASNVKPDPATQPSAWPRTPAVYHFDKLQWRRVMALPLEVDAKDPSAFSFAIIDHQPVLATSSGGDGIHMWTGQDDHWSAPINLNSPLPVINFDILSAGVPPTIWLTSGGPGVLADLAGNRALQSDESAPTDPRSAARAAEAIRLYSATGDHVYEQAYGSDGTPMGKRSELAVDLVSPDSEIQNWLAPTLTVIVTMLLFGAARRGGIGDLPPSLAEAHLSLAPLFPRFAAGAIDAIPVMLSMLYAAWQMSIQGVTNGMPSNDQLVPFYIGSGVYVVYTIGAELLFGRTFGKWIFGLQIVSDDGTRPTRVALLVRNVLRLVDLVLIWLPLAMVLFSPLRQRLGDLAAGTLVVRADAPQKPEAPPV
jgi:uncharacterized RDD family membrane protein YckC